MTRLNQLKGNDWEDLHSIIMFGYGRLARKIYNGLKRDFEIVVIIDNSEDKQGMEVDNIKIISFDEAKLLLKKYKIIIAVQECNYVVIKKQLEEIGLVENIHFVSNQKFIAEWYYRFRNKTIVMRTDITVTSRCTLRCENCISQAPYWKHKFDFPLLEIEESLKSYFGIVDYVMDMDIGGGEPFLYKELKKLLKLIKEGYGNKIGYLGIITNGTIIPDIEIIKLLQQYDISISISDYSEELDYKDRVDKLCSLLDRYNIRYMRNKHIEWFEFGLTKGIYHYEGEAAYHHMQLCNSVCHILNDKKLYYCSVDYGAQRGGLIAKDSKGYIDLADGEDYAEKRRKLLELVAGYIEGGCPEACKICGGFGVDNQKRVPTARQLNGSNMENMFIEKEFR